MNQQGLVVDPDLFQHKLEKGGGAMLALASLTKTTGGVILASLCEEPLGFGREIAECLPLMANKAISRRHFELKMVAGDIFIRDVGSTNGTWVYDHWNLEFTKVTWEWMPLYRGDTIYLGAPDTSADLRLLVTEC